MTAAELYEIVKDDPEVWGNFVLRIRPGGKSSPLGGWVTNDVWSSRLSDTLAELALEALYARATGGGVYETQSDLPEMRFATKRQHHASQHGPTRLAALRAAYQANKENKR